MSITFEQVGYIYQEKTPFEHVGLKDVSFTMENGQYIAIVGHTGSGKSTLIQHLNALLKPTQGTIRLDGFTIDTQTTEKNLKPLRQKVGVVFQFPEAQLFEETVLKDVMFGPLNFGVTPLEAKEKAIRALHMVGIDEALFERSPFDLSGGQKRRVAIAGILAIEPDVLVLDEPTAGLDPRGRDDMMALFERLHDKNNLTTILVTHQMDDVVQYADHVLVLENGELIKKGRPVDVFQNKAWVQSHAIGLPSVMQVVQRLNDKGCRLPDTIVHEDALVDAIIQKIKEGDHA